MVAVEDALKAIESQGGEKEGWSKEKAESAEPAAPSVQFWNV